MYKTAALCKFLDFHGTDKNEGKNLFPTYVKPVSIYGFEQVQEMFEKREANFQKDSSENLNKSTLSLHIFAYENSFEDSSHAFAKFNEEKEGSKMNNEKPGKNYFPTYVKPVSTSGFKQVQEMLERREVIYQKDSSENLNTSTLSLHISAYDNSVEDSSLAFAKFNKEKEGIKMNNKKSGLNSFEYTRQQKNQTGEPEVMQFKASQRLLNPNKSKTEDRQKRKAFSSKSNLF
uniref:Uncharacterized protein n=1 Tax=Panagrolaimus sp. ES5 TaxID=591445 RepID=A0AC34FRF5_9BILA